MFWLLNWRNNLILVIRNLLYSLFLHFLLILLIYANFKLQNESQINEITVSLVSIAGNNNSDKANIAPTAKKEEKPPVEEAKDKKTEEPKSSKPSPKNKVQAQPKKVAKSKTPESAVKPTPSKKAPEVKKEEEKPKPKQQDSEKKKDDKKINENKDEERQPEKKKEKDLGSKKEASEQKQEEKQQEAASEEDQDEEEVNSLEDTSLSVREKLNIQSQLKRCYRKAILENNSPSTMKVMIRVKISQDGYIESNLEASVDAKRYNDPKELKYKIAIDNAKRALDICSPLRNLPTDKYDVWKEVILDFDENLGQ